MIKEFYQYWVISRSGIFDRNYYLLEYPDVRAEDINPLWHFVRYGWKEGKNPTKYFDTNFYLEKNLDVKINGINPLVHYIRFGLKEGRKPRAVVTQNNNQSEMFETKTTSILDSTQSSLLKANFLENIPEISSKISIIIPTKNAGDEFEFLLKMLINQTGFTDLEIVIVDSGSEDNTIHLAKMYGAKVISIAPDDFSHSYARNVGGENASGEYFLFIVQDALPPTKTWLAELVNVLITIQLSAVSCAEFPREDADLFYRVISWNHYEFLEVNKKDQVRELPKTSDYASLRKNGQLSDLACVMPKKVFNDYKYQTNYAEDLDFGLRLIKDGHRIGFLGSIRVIHSHNRPPYYFLKRGYVDNLYLSDIFTDFEVPETNFDELVSDILFTFNFLSTHLINEISNINYPCNPSEFFLKLKEIIGKPSFYFFPTNIPKPINQYVDEETHGFIMGLMKYYYVEDLSEKYKGIMMQALLDYLNRTFTYLENTYEIIDLDLAEEVKHCIYKEFSIIMGAHLSFCYKLNSTNDENILKIHKVLNQGV